MASTTVDSPAPAPDRLSLESLPIVDLRLLSQSELTALSMCSSRAFDLRRCDDVVIPKIDRSIFNESAGSRKQTYSRLRLAPRKPDLSPLPSKPRPSSLEPLDSERAENSRIISLFKDLFYSPSSTSNALVPVNVEYSDALNAGLSNTTVPVSISGEGEERKRKRGRKPKYLTEKSLALTVVEERWNHEGQVEGAGARDEFEKGLVNKNGVVVDLTQLATMEDPYGMELRRRTEGKDKPDELLGFINDLKGQWGSRRKKRKVVDANEFGDALPNGWKVLIGMKKKAGQAWVFCRRYISPSGRYFVSCKEVSSYLLSLTSPQDLKQQSTIQCIEDSLVEDKFTSGNFVGVGTKIDDPSLFIASQSNDCENQQRKICISQTVDQGKQMILYVQPGEVRAVSALKCHKCSTPFIEKDGLLNHLLSCHKRKRRKSGAPIEEDDMIKEGKYECQFCERTFHERSIYFGHVGIHVKNYLKNIGGSPITPKQKVSNTVSIGGAPVNISGTPVSVGINAESIIGVPNIQSSSEANLTDCNLKVGSDAAPHSENYDNDQNDPTLRFELNMEITENDKDLTDESSDKKIGMSHLSDMKVRNADKLADISAAKPDLCDGDDKVLFINESNYVCRYSGENASECAEPGISISAAVLEGMAGTSLPADKGAASEDGLQAHNKINPSSNHDVVDIALGNKNVEHSCLDEGLKVGNNDELMFESSSGRHGIVMDAANGIHLTGNLEQYSVVSHEEKTCGTTDNKIGYIESPLADSIESDSETCSPSGDQNYDKDFFSGLVNEAEVDVCSLGKGEVDTKHCIDQERQTESAVLFVSKSNDSNYFLDDSEKATSVIVMGPQGTGGFQAEQACSPEDTISTKELSIRIDGGPKCDEVANSVNFFFMSSNTDRPLDADVMTDNEQENILSGLSINERMNEVAIDNVSNASAGTATMQLPELDKDESLRGNKLMLDFGSMTDEISARFSNAVEHQTVPEGSSPFSLWGEQIVIEDNQSRAYGARELEQERASDNNSLNLVGLQQSCDSGYSLNKVCVSEQRYAVQHNETGFYNRSNEGEERISHGNMLNSGSFQQQCDVRYNLNKPYLNPQSFGDQNKPYLNPQSFVDQNKPYQAGTYNARDEARQERVAYGNSLTLASVQTCDTRYNLDKACTQQTCDSDYSLNKRYIGPVQGLSKLDGLEHSKDRHLMIGFGDSSSRPNQGVATEFMWRTTEGNIQSGGLVDSSSSQGQSSGSFQAFDFLSDKGGNGLYTSNEKYDMSSFEGLRSASVEPMEFSFLTTHDSSAQLEHPKVLSYSGEVDQGFGSSVWNQKGNSLPNMMGAHVVSTMCVWCGNEFNQDSLSCEIQAGSIGYLCPTCKARMSGQYL